MCDLNKTGDSSKACGEATDVLYGRLRPRSIQYTDVQLLEKALIEIEQASSDYLDGFREYRQVKEHVAGIWPQGPSDDPPPGRQKLTAQKLQKTAFCLLRADEPQQMHLAGPYLVLRGKNCAVCGEDLEKAKRVAVRIGPSYQCLDCGLNADHAQILASPDTARAWLQRHFE